MAEHLCPCLRCVVPVQRAVQRTTQRCNLRRFVLAGKKNLGTFQNGQPWSPQNTKITVNCNVAWCVALCFRNVSHCFALLRAALRTFTQHCVQIQCHATILGLFAPQVCPLYLHTSGQGVQTPSFYNVSDSPVNICSQSFIHAPPLTALTEGDFILANPQKNKNSVFTSAQQHRREHQDTSKSHMSDIAARQQQNLLQQTTNRLQPKVH